MNDRGIARRVPRRTVLVAVAVAAGLAGCDASPPAGCPEGQTACGDDCVDLQSSAAHCGSCDNECARGQSCVEGECACVDGEDCGGACVDVETDPSNCGGCGTRCEEGERCEDGLCVEETPPPPVITASCTESFVEDESCPTPSGTTYYVSTSGDDGNDGLSEASPIRTLARAGDLAVEPGDRVLFRCGDHWQGETLSLGRSGAECAHVVYGSYPAACEDQPRFSGSLPITGWTRDETGLWVADLHAGENAGRFPNGINQLFRGERRLPLGRWPNPDDEAFHNGYSRIASQPSDVVITDPSLPDVDWSGATLRFFSIRWLLLNRRVASSAAGTLTVSSPMSCYSGCGDPDPSDPEAFGWGYHLTNHIATLDEQDEWYFDRATGLVHLVSGAEPSEMEGSAIPAGIAQPEDPSNDDGYHGLIELGRQMGPPIHHVVVENIRVENGWRNGIALPVNQSGGDDHHVTIRCNTLRNVDSKGVVLATWHLSDPSREDGWGGGDHMVVANNVVDGPNHHGILTLANDVTIEGNLVVNVGLLSSLGQSGLGCGVGNDNCTENGTGITVETFRAEGTSLNVTVRRNRVERTGYDGIILFGTHVLAEENVVLQACSTKGDCGGITTAFGDDQTLRRNVVRDVISPPDGFNSVYHERFGFGLYVMLGTTDVLSEGNTVSETQGYGIIYQEAGTFGDVVGNTIYGVHGRSLAFSGFDGVVRSFTDNVLVATEPVRLLFAEGGGVVELSNHNYFIQPYLEGYIVFDIGGDWTWRSLPEWQAASGQDLDSVDAWFSLPEGAEPITELFVNDTAEERTVTLTGSYVDLDQAEVSGSFVLAPFASRVLVRQ